MIVWLLTSFILLCLALFFLPRKKNILPTPEEMHRAYQLERAMSIVDEKDTKRFYEDIRGLYDL
jgi:hypothetical protein